MDAEILPEPPHRERQALDEALADLLAERVDPYNDWWRAGVREAVDSDEEPV